MMHLKLAVLKLLDDQPRSGYDLMKALQEQIGRKPSPGSIYPLLEQLKRQNFITSRPAGRRIVYSLTSTGKQVLKGLLKQKEVLLDQIIENVRIYQSCCSPHSKALLNLLQELKQGKEPFKAFTPELAGFKASLLRLYAQDRLKQHQEHIKRIITEATNKLRELP